MPHQSEFNLPVNRGRQGLLQISTPTQDETAAASDLVQRTLSRLGSALPEPALA
jgi:hypothetical protein